MRSMLEQEEWRAIGKWAESAPRAASASELVFLAVLTAPSILKY
jgi:hypothetical protein